MLPAMQTKTCTPSAAAPPPSSSHLASCAHRTHSVVDRFDCKLSSVDFFPSTRPGGFAARHQPAQNHTDVCVCVCVFY